MSADRNRGVVCVLDHRFADLEQERSVLEPLGFKVKDGGDLSEADALRLAQESDAVLVGPRLRLDRARIGRLKRCRAIVRYGVGVDNIDTFAASDRGIAVSTVHDYAVQEVATHALALLLTLHRRLFYFDALVRGTRQAPAAQTQIPRLSGCTLGVVGFGRIGHELARQANPLGLGLLVSDPGLDPAMVRAAGAQPTELYTLVAEADFVSLHLPLTASTRHLIDEPALRRFKQASMLINVSRGGLVDERALAAALREGPLAGAALDTTEREPLPPDDPLLEVPNLILSPHVAWLSEGAKQDLQRGAAAELARVLHVEKAGSLCDEHGLRPSPPDGS